MFLQHALSAGHGPQRFLRTSSVSPQTPLRVAMIGISVLQAVKHRGVKRPAPSHTAGPGTGSLGLCPRPRVHTLSHAPRVHTLPVCHRAQNPPEGPPAASGPGWLAHSGRQKGPLRCTTWETGPGGQGDRSG